MSDAHLMQSFSVVATGRSRVLVSRAENEADAIRLALEHLNLYCDMDVEDIRVEATIKEVSQDAGRKD